MKTFGWSLLLWLLCFLAGCVLQGVATTPLLPQVTSLPTNAVPVNCYLLPSTVGSEVPYLLISFDGAYIDLTKIVVTCSNTIIKRECPDDARLRYLARNGFFSNPLGGDPHKPADRNYKVWHQYFAGDETYSSRVPLVQLYFWCDGPTGIKDALDPEFYVPPAPGDNS